MNLRKQVELGGKTLKNTLLKVRKASNRGSKFLILFFILFFLNIGSKYPVISNPSNEITEHSFEVEEFNYYKLEYERYKNLYDEIYQRILIQQIEFEAEVIIPSHFDFKYVKYIYDTSKELEIPHRVAFRLIYKESAFNSNALSSKGAQGLMQLMPDTRKHLYKELRVDTLNLDKNQEDIYIGLNYIRDLNEFWKSRGNSDKNLLRLSIASYNAGYGNVIKHKGVPPFAETQNFVNYILKPHSNPVFYATIVKKTDIHIDIS